MWGGGTGVLLAGLWLIEKPVFKSTALRSVGPPRLVFVTVFMSLLGFAIKGETYLIRAARVPSKVKSQ